MILDVKQLTLTHETNLLETMKTSLKFTEEEYTKEKQQLLDNGYESTAKINGTEMFRKEDDLTEQYIIHTKD